VFAPQVAQVLAPLAYLSVPDVVATLAAALPAAKGGSGAG
jgi:hypothetical protein